MISDPNILKHMKKKIIDGILKGEDILPDDYPIHWDYCYVCDGRVRISPLGGGCTIADLKRTEGFKEIRRCDLNARNLMEF